MATTAKPAAQRFCASCGTKLTAGANFCVECGERLPGAVAARAGFSFPVQRYAPLLVLLAVLTVGGGAIVYGVWNPKTPPSVPRREAPAPGDASGNVPEGHPPIAIPDQVKQVMRELAQKAAAAPDDMDVWKRLAEVQYRAGQLAPAHLTEAAASYRHIVEHEPHNLEAIRNLGNIAFDQQQNDTAIDYYKQYLKQKPDDLDVQTDLGTMYLSAGKIEPALQQYEAVLKANSSFFQAQFNMAIAYRTMGKLDKTVEALEKARALAPDDKTRKQVDQMIAQAKGGAPPAPASEAAAAPAPAVAAGTFQADAEAVFRQNPILGPKVQRIEWADAASAKVYLRQFPMDQMGDDMRNMFIDRMKGRIKEKKDAYKVTAATKFDLIDEASGNVMGTITE